MRIYDNHTEINVKYTRMWNWALKAREMDTVAEAPTRKLLYDYPWSENKTNDLYKTKPLYTLWIHQGI